LFERRRQLAEQETDINGRDVRGPTDINARGWWSVAKRTWNEGREDNLELIASGIAFNAFLALIPLLTAVVISYGLIASPAQVAEHIAVLADALPKQATAIVSDQLQNIVQSAGTGAGFGLILSLAIALYGALRGAMGIIVALNIVYGIDESRSFVRQLGVSLAITIGLVFMFVLASAAISIVNLVSNLLPDLGGLLQSLLQIGFWIGVAVASFSVIALIYAYAPNQERVEWRWLIPGSLIATVLWIAATFGFAYYIGNFGNYNATYGALGAVIVFLIWLYLSAYISLIGVELNQVLSRRAGRHENFGEAKSSMPVASEAQDEG
jgi:membrane protein